VGDKTPDHVKVFSSVIGGEKATCVTRCNGVVRIEQRESEVYLFMCQLNELTINNRTVKLR